MQFPTPVLGGSQLLGTTETVNEQSTVHFLPSIFSPPGVSTLMCIHTDTHIHKNKSLQDIKNDFNINHLGCIH